MNNYSVLGPDSCRIYYYITYNAWGLYLFVCNELVYTYIFGTPFPRHFGSDGYSVASLHTASLRILWDRIAAVQEKIVKNAKKIH